MSVASQPIPRPESPEPAQMAGRWGLSTHTAYQKPFHRIPTSRGSPRRLGGGAFPGCRDTPHHNSTAPGEIRCPGSTARCRACSRSPRSRTTCEHDLETRSLVSGPARCAREAARAWNAASDAFSAWPRQRLLVPDNRGSFALAMDDYPATLTQDVDAWCE